MMVTIYSSVVVIYKPICFDILLTYKSYLQSKSTLESHIISENNQTDLKNYEKKQDLNIDGKRANKDKKKD